MQNFLPKLLDFLERYCQWLAVAIAAAFFLFALWQYLPGVSMPVSIQDGSDVYQPGDFDVHVRDVAVVPLTNALNSNSKIDYSVPNYAKLFGDRLTGASSRPTTRPLPAVALNNNAIRLPSNWVFDEATVKQLVGPQQVAVAQLVNPPAALIDPAPTSGFAQVGEENPKDLTWVRVPYSISTNLMRQAFNSANIPANQADTAVVRVELIRERELSGNRWGEPEVIKPYTPPGATLRLPPAPGSATNAFLDFREWAAQNQPLILQPAFDKVVKGDDPNVAKPVEEVAAEVFDPATFPRNGNLDKLTTEQRNAVLEYRRKNPIQPTGGGQGGYTPTNGMGGNVPPGVAGPRGGGGRSQRAPRSSRGGGGNRPPGMRQEAIPSMPVPGTTLFQQGLPPGVQTGPPPGFVPPPAFNPYAPGAIPGVAPGAAATGGANPVIVSTPGAPINLAAPPTGLWDPNKLTGDIAGVCYDTTAQGDATYRYRIRYSIANPVFGGVNVADNPAITKTFELVGEDPQKWSDPVEIAPRTYVFLQTQPNLNSNSARFTIFTWENGRQHKSSQIAVSGDTIGHVDNGINFRSPWTFVETRKDPTTGSIYALLMNSEGRLRRQVASVDQSSAVQKRLQAEVDAAEGKPTAAAAGGGGAPNGVPGSPNFVPPQSGPPPGFVPPPQGPPPGVRR